jgi:hypothetical protein
VPLKIVALEELQKTRRNRGSRVENLPEWRDFIEAVAKGVNASQGIQVELGNEQRQQCGIRNVGGAFKHRAKQHLKKVGANYEVRNSKRGDTQVITIIPKL